MATALLPLPDVPAAELAALSFADAPDYRTAYAAALAHGLPPKEAMRCAYLKYLDTHNEHVRALDLANRYEADGEQRAMIDLTSHVQFLVLMLAEQAHEITALRSEVASLRLSSSPAPRQVPDVTP